MKLSYGFFIWACCIVAVYLWHEGVLPMKNLCFLTIFMLFAVFLFASPQQESQSTEAAPIKISMLHGGDTELPNGGTHFSWAIAQLENDFPNVEVELLAVDLSDGSTLTMSTLSAAGMAPNIYFDYVGRACAYIREEYALPLNGVMRDLHEYRDGMLDPYTRNGNVFAVPATLGVQGMAVNMDMMREIGFEPTFNWTVEDFVEMCRLVKERYSGQKYGTGMFAGNQSGDYLINNWFAAFGAEMYKSGDYSKTTIRETGGAQVYEFFQMLVKEGYVPPGSSALVDDDYVIQWAVGDIAATAFFPGWVQMYFDTVITQKKIDKPFECMFFPFPSATGKGTPTFGSSAVYVIKKTGTNEDEVAARLVEYLNSGWCQSILAQKGGNIPTRKDAAVLSEDPYVRQTAEIMIKNGIMDVGLTTPWYASIRPLHYPVLQKVLTFQLSPEEAIAEYERRINAEIAKKL
jgi:ABC-type glycerol-3-phosphate transport system substrate-binding protein